MRQLKQQFKQQFLSPKQFYQTSGKLLGLLKLSCAVFLAYGLIGGLILAPADYQQGDGFRILYIHAPSAFLAMAIYVTMAINALVHLVWRIKLASICMIVSARVGACFCALTLITGALWGEPMWGTWWIWDARLTSMLILLFLYLGTIALYQAIDKPIIRDRACSILSLVGVINIPVIHYSVQWWNTLHQGATISKLAKPSIAGSMLFPLLSMVAGFFLFYLLILLINMRSEILIRESKTKWVSDILSEC